MSTIKLTSNNSCTTTTISNIFIDSYMPYANGEYVKVYIYLLRLLSSGDTGLSILKIADHLDNTETDVIRALNYWEKCSLITIEKSTSGEISSIILEEPAVKEITYERTAYETGIVTPSASITQTETATTHTMEAKAKFERPTYTSTQIAELTNTDEVKWLMNIIEVYLKRNMTPNDVQLVLFIYETLGFSTDLILHLYDYCISRNKTNSSYIEAVAIAWKEEGIDTVEKADISIAKYNTNYNAVSKAFGLNRQPGDIEKKFMDKWFSSFGFSTDIIIEACNRTLLNTGKPDFKYANSIIENWYAKGVKTKADILVLDQKHNSRAASSRQQKQPQAKVNPKNQFNAFPQRDYSKDYISSLEERLLNKHE